MIFQEVFDRFVRRRPIAVMFRALLDNVFSAEKIDAIFRASRRSQRDSKELLFSSVVRLLALAVCRVKSSVHAGYRDEQEKFQVSVNSVYAKLDKAEPQVAQALVREPAAELESIIRQLKTTRPALLPGYRLKILDGKHFSATDHRIAETQGSNSAPLPGQAIAVLDPELMLVTDVFPCEDGHAQERSILPEVLETVEAGQLWMGDRNFCTTGFVFGIANRNAYFLIRQHKQNLYWAPVGRRRRIGRSETGVVYEQTVRLTDSDADDADELIVRRVTIVLDTPTRDGDTEIHLLTNVPSEDADAIQIATFYLDRWTIENVFQEISTALNGEINTLAYPSAAILGFCIALIAFNILSTVKAALRVEHGEDASPKNISGYHLADEIASAYDGMMVALPERYWAEDFGNLTPAQMARTLIRLSKNVDVRRYRKSKSRPGKRSTNRSSGKDRPHVSTARLLAQRAAKLAEA
jgi:hypothetical protein